MFLTAPGLGEIQVTPQEPGDKDEKFDIGKSKIVRVGQLPAAAVIELPLVLFANGTEKAMWAAFRSAKKGDLAAVGNLRPIEQILRFGMNKEGFVSIETDAADLLKVGNGWDGDRVKNADFAVRKTQSEANLKQQFSKFFSTYRKANTLLKISSILEKKSGSSKLHLKFLENPASEVYANEVLQASYFDGVPCPSKVSKETTPFLWNRIEAANQIEAEQER